MNKLIPLLSLAIFWMFSCQSDVKLLEDLGNKEIKVDVYVAGYVGRHAATYWKNGIPVTLSTNLSSACTSIYVSNEDVYITGHTQELPLYWKNEGRINLPVPANAVWGETNDIIVVGTDVYVCGTYTQPNHIAPVYWKNAERMEMQVPSPYTSGVAEKILIDGADVYLVGYVQSSNTALLTAALWKNDKFIPLPRPINYQVSRGRSVKISNGHVYVSGYITATPYDGSSIRAVYWKDGEMLFIESAKQSVASPLDVQGNDVYIPYHVYDQTLELYQIKYLKNDEEVLIDQGAIAWTYGLTTTKDGVYIVGTYKQSPESVAVATYWDNGKRVQLSEEESQALSCFVVQHN